MGRKDTQLRSCLVHTGNEECYTERSTLFRPLVSRGQRGWLKYKRTIIGSSSSVDSPKRRARSQTACVTLSTLMSSLNVNWWFYSRVAQLYSLHLARQIHLTCEVTRAWSTMVLASAVRPDIAQQTWLSISMIFSIDEDSSKTLCVRFSTPKMTPSEVDTPTVVEPS